MIVKQDRIRVLASLLLVFSVGACSDEGQPGACVNDPPPSALVTEAGFDVSVEPNPVEAGQEARLLISRVPPDQTIGPHAGWLCWDGTGWVGTHVLFAEDPPRVLEVQSGATITVAGSAVILPAELTIAIPDVDPGTYLLSVAGSGAGAGDNAATGSTLVEVSN